MGNLKLESEWKRTGFTMGLAVMTFFPVSGFTFTFFQISGFGSQVSNFPSSPSLLHLALNKLT
jgi:hypothetical protein